MKISQCMIVKNEEKNIERALSWGKSIMCEQIVVDTGSTDHTVEIAKKMGAKVFHFTWIDDFAAAKNYAIEQATGDWIAFLDADEYFLEEDVKKIPNILKQLDKEKYMVKGVKKKCNVVKAALYNLNISGQVKDVEEQTRIFRNVSYIRYKGRIHEQIAGRKKDDLLIADAKEMLKIYHTGYAWTEESREKKMIRNISMLRKELEINKDSAELQLYLAESLITHNEREEALYYAELATHNTDDSLQKYRIVVAYQMLLYETYKMQNDDNASVLEQKMLDFYQRAVKVDDTYPDFDIAMGFYMAVNKRWKEVILYLERALAKAEKKESLEYSRVLDRLPDIYTRLCIAYENLENAEKSFYYATLSLEVDPYQDALIIPLVYKLTYQDSATNEEIFALLKKFYDFSKRKDSLYVLKVVKKTQNVELEEMIKPLLAEEDRQLLYGTNK